MMPIQAMRLRRPVASTDPLFANVALLLHCEGANGSTTFTDSSSHARTGTANGNAQLTTTSPLHGTASGLLDGTGDYITYAHNNADNISSGPFCIEVSASFSALTGLNTILAKGPLTSGNFEWGFFTEDDDYLHFYYGTRGFSQAHIRLLVPTTLTTSTPYNIVIGRNASGDWFGRVNGSACTQYQYSAPAAGISYGSVTTGTFNSNVGLTTPNSDLVVGSFTADPTLDLPAKFDELRFTVGGDRFAGGYSASPPFPNS